VVLSTVSDTKLEIKWDALYYNGGDTIDKYLVEWDTVIGFENSSVSPTNPYSNPEGPLSHSMIVQAIFIKFGD